MENGWTYQFCAAFVVEHGVGKKQEELEGCIVGSQIEIEDIPQAVLEKLFIKSPDDYPVGFVFQPKRDNVNAIQVNDILSLVRLITNGLDAERLEAATAMALQLASVTREISGVGLLVFLVGRKGGRTRLLIWKFPHEDTIQAQSADQRIIIRQIKDAFSTESTYVKVAFLEDDDPLTGYWYGRLEDKQSRDRVKQVADYWITGFLKARRETSTAYGTRALSEAIKKTYSATKDPDQKIQLLASIISLRGFDGQSISIRAFVAQTLPGEVGELVIGLLEDPDLVDEEFEVSLDHIEAILKLRRLELENGFSVTGPIQQFKNVVSIEALDEEGNVRISFSGRIYREKILVGR